MARFISALIKILIGFEEKVDLSNDNAIDTGAEL